MTKIELDKEIVIRGRSKLFLDCCAIESVSNSIGTAAIVNQYVKYHVSCTDVKIPVGIIYFYYLFFHHRPTHKLCFLS